jgi:peptidoglycan/xylan/chitin deacetylase (PgdA/CDA1 family)
MLSLKKLSNTASVLASPSGGTLTVISFHRVEDPGFRSAVGQVGPDGFRTKLRWLKQCSSVVGLEEGLSRLREPGFRKHLSSITFDDGYRDNAEQALPILLDEGLKATFFVSTAFIEGEAMFSDVVAHALSRTGHERLDYPELGVSQKLLSDESERAALAVTLTERLKYLAPDLRDRLAQKLSEHLEVLPPRDLMMNAEQIRVLADHGMDVGSHTHRHVVGTTVEDHVFQIDVQRSIDALEAITGRRPAFFAFPNGRTGKDLGPNHRAIAERLRFRAAFTTDMGSVRVDSPQFGLPRFSPWADSKARFTFQMYMTSRLRFYDGDSHPVWA